MKFSYNWLKELTEIKESPQKLAELLTLRAFEVEGVDKIGDDWALDVKILPNRMADASGHRGLANEIGAIRKLKVKSLKFKVDEDKKRRANDILQIKVENPEDCPRYTARVMDGVKIGPSPEWMRERLAVCGLQSVNNVVDAANYVMLELGQPLHVFDFEFLKVEHVEIPKPKTQNPNKSQNPKPKTIIVRSARKGEKLSALDDKIYELNPEILVIADEKNPIAIAGIKGGKESGVSETTKRIVLESANFNPARIRKGSQALGLKTDASHRFEHGLDPNETLAAVERLAQLIQQLAGPVRNGISNGAGGQILGGVVDPYPKKTAASRILLRPAYVNRLIGENIPLSFIKDVLARIGCRVKHRVSDILVSPPTVRRDLLIEEDLIEEVARFWGYERLKPQAPLHALAPPERNVELFWEERTRDILIGAGFTESELYQFTGERELEQFLFQPRTDADATRTNAERKLQRESASSRRSSALVELENPTSPETKYLVPRALIKYITSAAENLRNFDAVNIFGIQKSFPGAGAPERKDLILTLAKKGASGEEEFYQLKGAIDQLLESLGISDYWYDDATSDIYHPYRVAEVKIGDEKIGMIGEIHPDILKNIKSKARIAAAEIDMVKLASLATTEAEFRPIGKYPAIVRDIAVVVPSDVKTEEVQNVIENIGGELLADTNLFDYFQDEQMREAEQKSLAFHLIFQSAERTLTDTEVGALIKKITAALEEKGWEVRK